MTEPGYPTSLGVSTEATISLLGEDITDLMGSVGFGELAYWLMTLAAPARERHASSRPSSSHSPTTASRRRPLRPA